MLDFLKEKIREPAECVIKVGADGEEATDIYPYITEVVVEAARDKATVATLKFETRRDENGKWSVQDSGYFFPWQKIIIEAAFGSYSEEIMRGYVREIKSEYPANAGDTTVTIECQDDSIALDREHVRCDWGVDSPVDDAYILKQIIETKYELKISDQCAAGQSGLVLLQDDTDIKFLRDRAQANGYELIFGQGKVYFGHMRLDAEPQEVVLVYAGQDTHCYNLSIQDDGHQPDAVAFDLAASEGAGSARQIIKPDLPLMGPDSADSGSLGLSEFTWLMTKEGASNESELQAKALQKVNDAAMKVKAQGELDGSLYGHVLQVAQPVPVDGLGDRYGGLYYVDTVTHTFNSDGYRQSFNLLRNAYGDNIEEVTSLSAGLI
jgi:hypothetical protein